MRALVVRWFEGRSDWFGVCFLFCLPSVNTTSWKCRRIVADGIVLRRRGRIECRSIESQTPRYYKKYRISAIIDDFGHTISAFLLNTLGTILGRRLVTSSQMAVTSKAIIGRDVWWILSDYGQLSKEKTTRNRINTSEDRFGEGTVYVTRVALYRAEPYWAELDRAPLVLVV